MFERELAATAAAMVTPGKGMYGRALQAPALKAWKGQAGNVPAAHKALAHRARLNGAACFGRYKAEMEKDALAA